MVNGNDQTFLMICLEFTEKKLIAGLGFVWIAKYQDYGNDEIVIIPDERFFVPQQKGVYVALRPRGFRSCNAYYEGHLIYKTKVFNVIPTRITENNISIFESDFFIPPCFLKKDDQNVLFRTTKIKNQYALIWFENDEMRNAIYRHFRKNIPYSKLEKNKSDIIEIVGERGETREGLEKRIIESINYCLKG